MKKEKIPEIASSLIVMLFIYTALSKLIDYNIFRYQLQRSPFFSAYSESIAWLIPSLELIAAILLIIKQTRLAGFYLSFFLMLSFTGYIYAILHFADEIPCSCGGVLSMMNWNQHFIFNIAFTLVALTGIFAQIKLSENSVAKVTPLLV
jgi:hypothetical protein